MVKENRLNHCTCLWPLEFLCPVACRTPWLLENSIDFTHSIGQKPRSAKVPYSVLFYLNLLSKCSCCNCVSDEFCSGDKLPWGCWRNTLDSLLLGILKWCLWSVISFPQLGLLEQNLYSFPLLWAYYRKSSVKPEKLFELTFFTSFRDILWRTPKCCF